MATDTASALQWAVSEAASCFSSADVLMPSLGWAAGYILLGTLLRRVVKGEVDSMPRWTYYVAAAHQLLAQPLLHCLILRRLLAEGVNVGEWLWGPSLFGLRVLPEHHIHFSVMGAMLRDVPDLRQNARAGPLVFAGFTVHHVFVVVGTACFLILPVGAGMTILLSATYEVTSGFYCLFKVRPGALSALAYVVTMAFSLIVGPVLVDRLMSPLANQMFVPIAWSLCFGLTVIRGAGLVMEHPNVLGALSRARPRATKAA